MSADKKVIIIGSNEHLAQIEARITALEIQAAQIAGKFAPTPGKTYSVVESEPSAERLADSREQFNKFTNDQNNLTPAGDRVDGQQP